MAHSMSCGTPKCCSQRRASAATARSWPSSSSWLSLGSLDTLDGAEAVHRRGIGVARARDERLAQPGNRADNGHAASPAGRVRAEGDARHVSRHHPLDEHGRRGRHSSQPMRAPIRQDARAEARAPDIGHPRGDIPWRDIEVRGQLPGERVLAAVLIAGG